MRCSLLADPHAVSCKVELFGNSLALIAAAHKYSTNRSFLCSASRSCQTRHGNTDVCSGCFAGALCHFSGTFGGNCPLLLQSTLLHSQTFMLGLVTVSHKAIAKHLRRTRYIDNALGDHTAGKRFRQGKLQIFLFQKIDHRFLQCLALICGENILSKTLL